MLYFDELLKADDFSGAVNALATDFMKEYGLEKVHQVGLVVPDVEAAAEKLEKEGFGPFFIATGSPVFWKEKGRETGKFPGNWVWRIMKESNWNFWNR